MLTEGMFIDDRYEIVGKIGAGGINTYGSQPRLRSRNANNQTFQAQMICAMNTT